MAPFVFRRKPLAYLVQDLYNSHNGRYAGIYLFGKPTLMLRDLELIKQLGVKEFDHFPDRKPFVSDDVDPVLGRVLTSLSGQKWKNMRSTVSPAFTSSRLRAMFILINESAEQFVDYFDKKVDPNKTMTVELKEIFTRFANDVIATVAFGIKCDSMIDKNNEFYVMAQAATNIGPKKVLTFFGYMIVPRLMQHLKLPILQKYVADFFRNLVLNTIKTRIQEGIVRPDMIHLLLEARKGKLKQDFSKKDADAGFATVEETDVNKNSPDTKPDLTDDDLVAQAYTFFSAGFDSISNALSYIGYELAMNIDIQEKLQQEIDATLKECDGKFTYEAILKMKYLDMVVCEFLRKWPPGIVLDRFCVQPYTIQPENPGEYPVPLQKYDPLWIPVFGIHRDPKYYPNPEKFDPERFNDENKAKIVPFSYLPFGVGPRNCIGSRLALLETKTLLVHFLTKFSFVIVEKTQIPLKLAKWNFHLKVENGFWVGIKHRST